MIKKVYMKKCILILGLFLIGSIPVLAQKVLLEQNVAQDTLPENFGPNQKHFGHFYVGFGMMAGAAEAKSSAIDHLKSHEFLLGYRFKYKVSNFYSVGLDGFSTFQTYYLKQQAGKTLPTKILFDEEKLKFTNLGLSFYNRFNYGKRGNHIGNFVDLGVYGNWMPIKVHIYEDDDLFGTNGWLAAIKDVKVRETGLRYVTDFNYGALLRLGFNRYVFYGSYRLSDLFNTGYTVTDGNGNNLFKFAELPRLSVGFQIGIH